MNKTGRIPEWSRDSRRLEVGGGAGGGEDKEIAKAVLSELWFDSKCPNRRLHSC